LLFDTLIPAFSRGEKEILRGFLNIYSRTVWIIEIQQRDPYNVHMIDFEWDSVKARANLKKHGISFLEAKSVFYDEFAIQFYDAENSEREDDRFLMLGLSCESRILIVCHCQRDSGNTIRIISARKATRNERKFYEGDA